MLTLFKALTPFAPPVKLCQFQLMQEVKQENPECKRPLDEIQVDIVPNPEPMGLSADTRFNYFLILCDRFSRTFRMCVESETKQQMHA